MDAMLEQLLQYLRALWLRRFWGLAAAWIVGVGGIAFALLTPSQYEASARVFVDTQSVLKPLMAGLAVQPNNEQQVKMLADSLLSRPNVEKLVGLAGLDRNVSTEQERNKVIESTAAGVVFARSDKNNFFTLSYRSTDPAKAKRIVDSLLSMFVDSGAATTRRDTSKAMTFLDAQIADYETVLKKAEARLKAFKLQNIDHLASSSDSVGSMLALESEIEKVRTELRAAEQRRAVLHRQLAGEDPAFLADSTSAAADSAAEIDARADVLRRNLDELLRKYTEQHPDVIGTRRIIADLETQRDAILQARRHGEPRTPPPSSARRLPNPVYQQLKVAVAEAEATVAGLADRVANMESRYNRLRTSAKLEPEFEEQLAQLNREYQIEKNNYEQLVQRREQAKLTGELDEAGTVDFRVIDPPRVGPVAPNRLQLILAALALSAAAGVASSFVLSQAFPTVSTVKQLTILTGVPILGAISNWATPSVQLKRKRAHYAFIAGTCGWFGLFAIALTLWFAGPK